MIFWIRAVPDPDLEICGEGWGVHPNSEIRGGPPVSPQIFSAYRASVWSKNKVGGGGGAARAPPLDPPLSWSLIGDGGTWRIRLYALFFF